MKIKSLHLKHYLRLSFTGLDEICLTFDQPHVVILGPNGCGKSSLVKECSPMPADHTFYGLGGFKVVNIEHRGSQYRLESLFTEAKPRYLFYKDGENLNPSRLISGYLDMVKKEFGLKPDVLQVIYGEVPFSSLPEAKRRQWFAGIPGVDYTYGLSLHKKINEAYRQQLSIIKDHQSRLLKEQNSRLNPEHIQTLHREIKLLTQGLEVCLDNKPNPKKDRYTLEAELAKDSVRAQSVLESLAKLKESMVNTDPEFLQSQKDIEIQAGKDLAVITHIQDDLYRQIEKATEKLQTLSVPSQEAAAQLRQELICLKEEVTNLQASIKLSIPLEDFDVKYAQLPWLDSELSTLFYQLAEYADVPYTAAALQQAQLKAAEISPQIDRLTQDIRLIDDELSHHDSHAQEQTQCPKCSHTFNPYIKHSKESLLKRKDIQQEARARCEKELLELNAFITACTYKVDLLKRLGALRAKTLPASQWFFDELVKLDCVKTKPLEALSFFDQYRQDLQHLKTLRDKQKAIEEKQTHLRNFEQADLARLMQLTQEVEELTRKYHEQQDRGSAILTIQAQAKHNLSQAQLLQSLMDKAKLLYLKRHEYRSSFDEIFLTQATTQIVTYLRSEINVRQQLLFNAELIEEKLLDIEKSILESQLKAKRLKTAADALWTFITTQLSVFLKSFTASVNEVCSSIYTYPIEVVAKEVSGDSSLDFKFEVIKNDDKENASKDISETSKGQKEILDLAFMLANIRHYGFLNYPLVLDEFAVHQDVMHRNRAYAYVQDLVQSGQHSQVFTISHHAANYGALTDAQFVILSKSNIELPEHLKQTSLTL